MPPPPQKRERMKTGMVLKGFCLLLIAFNLYIKREARLRETNWSSKNGGFADGLVTLPRKAKHS